MVDTLNDSGQQDKGQASAVVDFSETVNSFMDLFRGRTDAWGSVDGKRNKQPVTIENYQAHLNGRVSLGVYPLLDDGTCHFAAVDLDKKNFEKILKVRKELLNIGIKSYFAQAGIDKSMEERI